MGYNINPHLLNLAFLVAAVEHCYSRGAIEFFYSQLPGGSTRKDFRNAVRAICCSHPDGPYAVKSGAEDENASKKKSASKEERLVCRYGDEEVRRVWFNTDVLILLPLFEWLHTVDPDSLLRDCEQLAGNGIKSDAVKEIARRWQKRGYRRLKELADARDPHDPLAPLTQQRVRHFQYMAKWFRTHTDGGDDRSLLELLTDDQVLAFWRAHWPDGSIDEEPDRNTYRTFGLVAELSLHFWAATDAGLREMSRPLSIMIRADEFDSVPDDALDPTDEVVSGDSAALMRDLKSSPLAKIKFLKNTEIKFVTPVAYAGAAGRQLPLTLLRMEAFGRYQRELGKAARRPRAIASALINCPNARSYCTWVSGIRTIQERIALVRDCCLHVLVHLRSPDAIGRLREALPSAECWISLITWRTEEDLENAVCSFFRDLTKLKLRTPELNLYLQGIERSFENVNTQGFRTLPHRNSQIDGWEAADVYARGDKCLAGLNAVMAGFLGSLPAPDCLDRQFRSDLCTFREGFARMYAPGGSA